MAIINFSFTKIKAEHLGSVKGRININTTITIKDVMDVELVLGKVKEKGLKVDFSYLTVYEPKVGKILVDGVIVLIEKEDNIKKMKQMWKEEKKLPDPMMGYLFNEIMRKANVETILLSREVNLPLPVRLPSVKLAPTSTSKPNKEIKKEKIRKEKIGKEEKKEEKK